MSFEGLHTKTSEVFAPETSREKFFRLLQHDDRNSFYFISTNAEGAWTDIPLRAKYLSMYSFDPSHNYYVTHNGFEGKRRLSDKTRQLNALFYDIDCHRVPSQAERETLIQTVLDRLADAVLTERFPMPTLIVDTGRGVQLYLVLNRSIPYRCQKGGTVNDEAVSYFKDVQKRLADVLEELVAGLPGVDVDRCVFDHSRVGRVPDTLNTKAGRRARLVNACEIFYDLAILAKFRPTNKPKAATRIPSLSKAKPASMVKFNALMITRLKNVADLQKHRNYDCQGSRELMSFVFYNTAAQIYDRTIAIEMLSAFNAKFTSPLPKFELAGIVSSVNNVTNVKGEKGYYVLSANTVADYLSLTREEIEATGFFASKRKVDRMEAKRKTKERKEARNNSIIDLYRSGEMTQLQVANEVGCSVRTVHAVLKEAGLTKIIKSEHAQAERSAIVSPREDEGNVLNTIAQVSAENAAKYFLRGEPAKKWRPSLGGSAHLGIFSNFRMDGRLQVVSYGHTAPQQFVFPQLNSVFCGKTFVNFPFSLIKSLALPHCSLTWRGGGPWLHFDRVSPRLYSWFPAQLEFAQAP